MRFWNYAIASLIVLPVSAVQANTALDSGNRFTGGLLLQDTSYEVGNGSADVEGQFLIGGYKSTLTPRFAVGGGLGLMLDGEVGDANKIGDGSGFRLFGDLQYEAHRFDQNRILITGTLSHDRFNFEEPNVDVDLTLTELKAGGLFLRDIQEFSLYAGMEILLYSDGEFESGNSQTDVERDDRLNLRLGAAFHASKTLSLKADLLIVGEQTILLGADFNI